KAFEGLGKEWKREGLARLSEGHRYLECYTATGGKFPGDYGLGMGGIPKTMEDMTSEKMFVVRAP
ncbi:hypothetical protein EBX31_14735, partial [bacterium]|nr:hypothetical protein [bacterium]